MLDIRHGRRPVASIALLFAAGVGSLLEACAAAPPPTPPPLPTPSASAIAAAPKPRWLPIESEPERDRARWKVRVSKDSELLVDSAGMRWEVTPSGTRHADTFLPDVAGPGRLVWQDGIGLVLVGDSRKIFLSTEPLGELVEKSTLPAGADVQTTLVYRGGLGIVVDGKPMISDDLIHWRPVPSMGDRVAVHAVVGRDGKGIALFAPQSVAATNDGGKSWIALPDDEGPMVKLSVDEEDPTAVLIEPRRPRDQLMRRWRAGSTEIDAFASPDANAGRNSARARSRRMMPMPMMQPGGQRVFNESYDNVSEPHKRLTKGGGLHQSRVSIDGDTVVFAPRLVKDNDKPAVVWETGTLGGPIRRVMQPLDTPPKEANQLRIATCAGTVATTVGRDVRVTDPAGTTKVIPIGIVPHRMAFLGPRKLLVVGRADQAGGGSDGDGKTTEAIEVDLDAADPKAALTSTKLESGDDHGTGTLVGGCAATTKSAWLVSYGRGMRLQTLRDGKWSSVLKPDKEYSGTPDVLAVEADGTLVLLELGEKSGKVVRVTPSGEVTSKATGFKLTTQLLVGDPSSRHAITMDSDGHAHQTDNAGETWTLLVDPPAAVKKVHRTVLCGASRCELDDLTVRLGWEPDAIPAPPLAADENKADPSGAEATAAPPITLTCAADKGAAPKMPATIEGVHGVAAGRGDMLWSGVAAAKSLRENEPAHFIALDGKPDGSVTSHELGRSLPDLDGFWFANESIGAVFVLRPANPMLPVETLTFSVNWQHDLSKPPKKYTFKSLWLGADAFARAIQTEDGFAMIESTDQKIHWFHDNGTVTVRSWPGVLTGRAPELAGSRLVEAASGTWYALIPAGEMLETSDATSAISLVAIDPTGGRKFRTFRVSATGLEERGLGLVKDGQGVSLAAVERTNEGGIELRLRPVNADLSLGAAKGVPGAKSAPGKILTLPACSATPQGETLTLMTDDEAAVTVDGSDHAGVMMRRARVTASSVCIERTMITRSLANELDNLLPHETENEIVIAGNGEGAAVLQDKVDNEVAGLSALKCSIVGK